MARRSAVPLLLELLAARGVRATFFVPGRTAERHPERIAEIVAAGHELAHHGYTHTSPSDLSPEEEDNELGKGLEVLRSFNAEVVGYRSPAWDFSAHTEDLLVRHGFAYSSNFMDDLRPYRREASGIVEVPIQWTLDDAPYFWFDAESGTRRSRPPPRSARSGKGSFVATASSVARSCSRCTRDHWAPLPARAARGLPRSRARPRRRVGGHVPRARGACAMTAFPHVRVAVASALERGRAIRRGRRASACTDPSRPIERCSRHYAGWDWDTVREQALAYRERDRRFDPRLAEEIRGIAEGPVSRRRTSWRSTCAPR